MKTSLKIRLLRHSIFHDQHQMAEKLNISVAEYSRIETGLDKLSPNIAAQLAGIFGQSVENMGNENYLG